MSSRSLSLLFFTAVALASPAGAHPLPRLQHDRTVAVRLAPTAVTVKYTLELNPLTLFLDGKDLFTTAEIGELTGQRDYAAAYAKKMGPQLADNLRATLDGKPLNFRIEKQDLELGDHIRCQYVFKADWVLSPGKKAAFAIEDLNYLDKPGTLNLTLDRSDPGQSLELLELEEPPAGLRNRASIDLKPGESDLLRKASAVIEVQARAEPQSPVVSGSEPMVSVHEVGKPSLAEGLMSRGLVALFDTGYGLGVLLLGAFLFGAAHAFTPGHGKTLVAAYLVGERGTVGHAVLLAVATTVAHTGSVIAIAAVLWAAYGNDVPGTTQGVLQFLGGLLVAGVGLWLLMRRLTGKADHFHLFGDHHHHHGDGHHHHHGAGADHHHGPPLERARTKAGWARLLLMGLGGGLIPCWDAVLLLIAAISFNRVAFAVPLLFAFSFGLGSVLVILGVGVVYAYRAGATRFQEGRWFRLLPTVSAILLVAIGFWLCQEGLKLAGG